MTEPNYIPDCAPHILTLHDLIWKIFSATGDTALSAQMLAVSLDYEPDAQKLAQAAHLKRLAGTDDLQAACFEFIDDMRRLATDIAILSEG